MTASTDSNVKQKLETLVVEPFPRPLGDFARIRIDNPGSGTARVEFGVPVARIAAELVERIESQSGVGVAISQNIVAHGVQSQLKPLPGIRNVIAIASGKGGVGKSTVAVNLALALKAAGARVGLLDADVYGPSQPHMLGVVGEQPETTDGKTMAPVEAQGLQVMSIGFLVDAEKPMVWRGPMVTSALNQMLKQTNWDDLDYLIVDMPPGTGDIQLTLAQQIPVAGAVIVTTPQDISLIDARKGLEMFRKVSIPVLGIIENMSMHVCSSCGHAEPIFGEGGGQKLAEATDVRLLGQLPLNATIREQTDSGRPTVGIEPDSALAKPYLDAADAIALELATRDRDYSAKFPNIVVEDS